MRSLVTGVTAVGLLSAVTAYAGDQLPLPAAAPSPIYLAQTGAPAEAKGKPDATISFSGSSVAAGIGFSWGNGTINYQGQQQPFHINGLSVVAVGITSVNATGEVYNLKSLNDFPGTYAAVSAGATVVGGGSVAYLRNEQGVVIKINSATQGLNFQFAADGVKISLGS